MKKPAVAGTKSSKMMTSEKVVFEAQFENAFISWKSHALFLWYSIYYSLF